jgi:hypothetical protein
VSAVDLAQQLAAASPMLAIVFDGPPAPEGCNFVEAEIAGHSVAVGEWKQRPDGYWVLAIPWTEPQQIADLRADNARQAVDLDAARRELARTLDALVRTETAFPSLAALIDAARTAPRYTPVRDNSTADIIADAYDAECERRGLTSRSRPAHEMRVTP